MSLPIMDVMEDVELVQEKSLWTMNDVYQYTSYLYLTITLLSLLWFGYKLIKLTRRISNMPKTAIHQNIRVDRSSSDAYSFLHYIVLPKDYEELSQLEIVLLHEEVHVHHKHSLDLILVEGLKHVFWFNPMIRLLQKEVNLNLEYIVDQEIAKREDSYTYQRALVLYESNKIACVPVVNTFGSSDLKKRILMLNNPKSTNMKRLKLLLITPVLAGFFFLFQIEVKAKYIESPAFEEDHVEDTLLDEYTSMTTEVEEDQLDQSGKKKAPSHDDMAAIAEEAIRIGEEASRLVDESERIREEAERVSKEILEERKVILAKAEEMRKVNLAKTDRERKEILAKVEKIKKESLSKAEEARKVALKTREESLAKAGIARANAITEVKNREWKVKANKVEIDFSEDTVIDGENVVIIKSGKRSKGEFVYYVNGKLYDESNKHEAEALVEKYGAKGVRVYSRAAAADELGYTGNGSVFGFTLMTDEDRANEARVEALTKKYKEKVIKDMTQVQNSDYKGLVYINGVKKSAEDLKNIRTDKMVSMDVFKGDAAVKKYGEEGREGVILIRVKP
ncbi:M56 family metallopeptidase [Myroides odoratimimus]|uniref:M56 family metallopeptidase n=2 Tax=Myroides TaxID=76831 RepID=UPI0025784CAE|nr:M56 family metallopeptidase [Myroides odoratimimus]MEC4036852.1 M56 family metallopeptidase [Myroides odoratimimus]MEC4092816.1 M56 family metallopeptidase [Myroides odoratimimus]